MSAPAWQDVLPSPPAGTRLVEAWFTTYERPDTALLVEHLLPSLVGASRAPGQDPKESTLFFAELGTTLEALRGRLTVISSPHRQVREAAPAPYPWLWRYVGHFTVGAKTAAVQHAKLWAFHWKSNGQELLEIHISSTNLTTSAFREQLQAGWSTCVELETEPDKARQQRWGDLADFLEALGHSAGDQARQRLQRLLRLLGRAHPPAGATFIASIPGSSHRAARRLKDLKFSTVHVLSPTIGNWTPATLQAWCKDLGIAPRHVALKWIDADHPWKDGGGWTLPKVAAATLKAQLAGIHRLPSELQLCAEHADGTTRWSHAKLYLLCKGKSRHLLVTSANWSTSAWGAGKTSPSNFELGVVFRTEWGVLKSFDTPLAEPHCCERSDVENTALQWAQAYWDGQQISLHARSTDAATPIAATVRFSGGTAMEMIMRSGREATGKWRNARCPPLTARIEQGGEVLEIDVIDQRLSEDFIHTPLPEIDPAQAQALREVFLLERYGGPAVDDAGTPGHDSRKKKNDRGRDTRGLPADYSLPAWLDSRAGFDIVDNWQAARDQATEAEQEQLRCDGAQLALIYRRRADAAGLLVAQELGWRLEEPQ